MEFVDAIHEGKIHHKSASLYHWYSPAYKLELHMVLKAYKNTHVNWFSYYTTILEFESSNMEKILKGVTEKNAHKRAEFYVAAGLSPETIEAVKDLWKYRSEIMELAKKSGFKYFHIEMMHKEAMDKVEYKKP